MSGLAPTSGCEMSTNPLRRIIVFEGALVEGIHHRGFADQPHDPDERPVGNPRLLPRQHGGRNEEPSRLEHALKICSSAADRSSRRCNRLYAQMPSKLSASSARQGVVEGPRVEGDVVDLLRLGLAVGNVGHLTREVEPVRPARRTQPSGGPATPSHSQCRGRRPSASSGTS